jgi:hypothetical protein
MDTLHIWLSLSLSLSNTKPSWSRITKDDISKPTPQHHFPTLFGPLWNVSQREIGPVI